MNRAEILERLEQRGYDYKLVEHPPVYTIDEMMEVGLPYPDSVAKNLFLRDDKKRAYYLLVCRHDRKVDMKALRKTLRSRPLSMASEEDLMEILKLTPGSVTPFGVLSDYWRTTQVVIDSAFDGRRIGIHPNDNTATVFMYTDDLVEMLRSHGSQVDLIDMGPR